MSSRTYGLFENFKQRAKEQPLVAGGLGLTCGSLIAAAVFMRRGNRQMSNHMLRLRVLAQSLTIAALLIGTMHVSYKTEKKQEEKQEEKQA